MRKSIAAAALSASILSGAGLGAVLFAPVSATAQTETQQTESGQSTDEGARPEPGAWVDDALQGLVDDGTITAEQATAVADALDAARPAHGPGGRPGPGLDAAAEAIGIESDALREQLQGGATIAEVAQANGVDVQTVIDAMLADLQAHLAEEVAAGEHTQEEADQRLADAGERITDMVNNGKPERPAGGPGEETPAGS